MLPVPETLLIPTDKLILPSYESFTIPETTANNLGIDIKLDPVGLMIAMKNAGEILGTFRSLDKYFVAWPAKPYFGKDSGGRQVFVIPGYGKPINYQELVRSEIVVFWNQMLTHILDNGITVVFNHAPRIDDVSSQTMGTLHFQILKIPMNVSRNPNHTLIDKRIAEPFGSAITQFLKWHFSRDSYSGFISYFGAKIDNRRLKLTGYPSGGIAFTFDHESELNGEKLHEFINALVINYHRLHNYIYQTMVDQTAYGATNILKGSAGEGLGSYRPKVFGEEYYKDELKTYFLSKPNFPPNAEYFFNNLYEAISQGNKQPDIVVPYTLAVTKELGRIQVVFDPHFLKVGGSVEIFGRTFDRVVDKECDGSWIFKQAQELANLLQVSPNPP